MGDVQAVRQLIETPGFLRHSQATSYENKKNISCPCPFKAQWMKWIPVMHFWGECCQICWARLVEPAWLWESWGTKQKGWERSSARYSLGLRTRNYMVAQDESGEIEVTEGGTSCGSFDVRVGTSRPAASCVGLLPKLCASHTSIKTLAHFYNLGPFSWFWLSYLRALKPTLVTRVSESCVCIL